MKEIPFLDLAEQGKNSLLRYAISLPFILGAWVLIGGIFTLMLMGGFSSPSLVAELEMSTPRSFVAFMASFIPWLLATMMAVRWIHGRPLRTLVTAYERPRWQRLAEGFGYWFLLVTLASFLEAWLYPGRYRFFFPAAWKDYLLPALILIPVQTSTEEIFFRGYLLQAMGLKIRNLWMLLLLSGIFFALPHIFNPEVSVNFWLVMASYFVTGVFA
ncbi:MAG: CPBP family intramembrane glutamic endopeptidase, partial [Anaerolineales bacterium]